MMVVKTASLWYISKKMVCVDICSASSEDTTRSLILLGSFEESCLDKRSNNEVAFETHDSRDNWGELITWDQAGGHGIWCPVDQYLDLVETFCQNGAGTDGHLNHETSDMFGISLTNQDDPTAPSADGNLVCKSRTALQPFTFLLTPLSRSTFGKT